MAVMLHAGELQAGHFQSNSDGPGLPAALERYFERALYLMLLTAFVALASTGGLDIPVVFLVSGALLFRGYLLIKQSSLPISERWTNVVTIAYVGFYVADYVLISRSFLSATVHLVLFVMVVRLFSAKRERDYYFLAALAFLMILAASLLTVDSLFLLAFSVFMLTAVATFILMEMRHSSAKAAIQAKGPTDAHASRRMAISLAGAAPLIVLQILIGAAAIFFVLPRVSAGYLSAYALRNELATGFSDRVELGQIGQIQQSSAVVMHVRIDGDKDGAFNLKWRGVTLNVFDGRVWSNSHELHLAPRLPDGRFALWPMLAGSSAPMRAAESQEIGSNEKTRSIHYRVLMEPTGTNVFFLAPRPTNLLGRYRQISMDRGETVLDLDADHPVSSYEAWSDISRPDAAELRAATGSYPPDVQLEYLELPPLDPRIPQLAGSITATAKNNYDKAAAIENYLLTHFTYTLQLSRTRPSDPIAEFLFTRKQGHCEYFAASMAVMLRGLGIPSRVVNGFRANEFNDLTSQYVVRDSDAHSWVEAYFPGYGWVSFDPTPDGLAQSHTAWGRVMLYVDAMESFWREWVIEYNANQQVALGASAINSSRSSFFRLRRWIRHRYARLLAGARQAHTGVAGSWRRWSAMVAATVLSLLLLISGLIGGPGLWRALARRRLAAHPERAPGKAAELWYGRMLHSLARKGWRKLATQTPGEFARRIESEVVREEVGRFTLHYEWARFGGSADHARRLPELYESVVASTRR